MCVKTEGSVGIVCRQMNSRGETNEECRKKEGTILIGFSLSLSFSLSLLLGGRTGDCWLYRGKMGFLTSALHC